MRSEEETDRTEWIIATVSPFTRDGREISSVAAVTRYRQHPIGGS